MSHDREQLFGSFEVQHTPGVARALVKVCESGNQIMVTDVGGYDLPPAEGPFQVMLLTAYDEPIEGPLEFADKVAMQQWIESNAELLS